MLARIGQEHGPLPQRTAQDTNLVSRPKRPGEEAKGVEALEPLAIVHVTLGSAPDLLDLLRIDEKHLEATGLQQLKEGDPIDACRFQGYGRDATHHQPGGSGFQISCVRSETTHGLGIVTRGHGDKMRFRPDVDACRMQVDGGQLRWEGGRGLRGFALA
jgi:hypothetical protein